MKILQKTAFGNDWGRFVFKEIPDGYKAGADIAVQKKEYAQLWEDTKEKLHDLTEETVLAGESVSEVFDSQGEELLSKQIARMLNESGEWEKIGDFPKTKFVMKKLTEMGLKINTPKDFIGKKLVIEQGNIIVLDIAGGEHVSSLPLSFAESIMAGDEEENQKLNTERASSSREELSSMEKITTQVAPISSIKKDQKKSVSEKVLGSKVEQKEKSPEELILEGKNAVREFWGLKGFSSISKKIRRFGFSKTVENLSVTTTGGKNAIAFKNETFLFTENAEGILKNLKKAAEMKNEMIENYWNNMARLSVSRTNAKMNFPKYEDCFFDLPEDVSFKGVTKQQGYYLIFKKGRSLVYVDFDRSNETYKIMDISRRTGLARVPVFAKKIYKEFTSEELGQWFKKKSPDVEMDLPE